MGWGEENEAVRMSYYELGEENEWVGGWGMWWETYLVAKGGVTRTPTAGREVDSGNNAWHDSRRLDLKRWVGGWVGGWVVDGWVVGR